MADSWRMAYLANACTEFFEPDASEPNVLTKFVNLTIKSKKENVNTLAWDFSVMLWKRRILALKKTVDAGATASILEQLLKNVPEPGRLLSGLYFNVHPQNIGTLSSEELDLIFTFANDFSHEEWFNVLGSFALIDTSRVTVNLCEMLNALVSQPEKINRCVWTFVQSIYLMSLRYNQGCSNLLMQWIIDIISKYELDGNILGSHDLESLRDKSDFQIDIREMTGLISARIELEGKPKPYDKFDIMPHNFKIDKWCSLNEYPSEEDGFKEFCLLALSNSFVALYWMPRYLFKLDSGGMYVAGFMNKYLEENTNLDTKGLKRLSYLASFYEMTSEAWSAIAKPIINRASSLSRDDRKQIYSGLTKKREGVFRVVPGEVPEYASKELKDARRMYEAEPLESPFKAYRKWALERAEALFNYEKEQAEEIND
jgi:hypothetical protein